MREFCTCVFVCLQCDYNEVSQEPQEWSLKPPKQHAHSSALTVSCNTFFGGAQLQNSPRILGMSPVTRLQQLSRLLSMHQLVPGDTGIT